MKYKLEVEGIDEIMLILGKKIAKLANSNEAKLDSTSLDASRYSKHSEFNPHYNCKIDKAHIKIIAYAIEYFILILLLYVILN